MLVKISCIDINKQIEFNSDNLKFQSNTYATYLPKFYNGVSFVMGRDSFVDIINDVKSMLGLDVIVEISEWNVKIKYHNTKCIFNDIYFYIFGEESEWI